MSLSMRSLATSAFVLAAGFVLLFASCGEPECSPYCHDMVCGDDGCGGSCGFCEEGAVCYAGSCVPECEDGLNYCDGYCVDLLVDRNHCGECELSCPAGEPCLHGECESSSCTPNCLGRECGDDGCFGSCGTCGTGMSCELGICVESTCTPDCLGRECGDDGCQGSCGTCDTGFSCVGGACVDDQQGEYAVLVTWESTCEPGASAPPSESNAANASSLLTAHGVRETASSHEYHSFICVSDAYSTKHWNKEDFDEKYWMVRISTTGYEELLVSSRQSGSNTGPRDFVLEYGTDGSQWTASGVSITVGTDWETGVVNRHPLPAALADSGEVYLRWRLDGQTSIAGETIGTTGAGRINGIVVEGMPR